MQPNDPGYPDPERAGSPAEAQVGLLLRDYADFVEPGPENWKEVGVRFFVRKGFVLVRDEFAARARTLLIAHPNVPDVDDPVSRARGPAHDRPVDVPAGLPQDGDVAHGLQWVRVTGIGVFEALRTIRKGFGDSSNRTAQLSGLAAPELLVHCAHSHGTVCPADEPQPVRRGSRPDPRVSDDREAGRGVRVLVLDSGLDRSSVGLPWMSGVSGDPDRGVVDNGGNRPAIGRYAGHGTFIAGVIRAMAPAAEVIVRDAVPPPVPGHQHPPGTIWESELAQALQRYLIEDSPDVINLSAGTYAEGEAQPMLLNAFYETVLRWHKGVVLVAAAGNDGGRQPFWPAASPWAVGVGALSENRRGRAGFSNHGGWVDVYAPGERLVNAFPAGDYVYGEPPYAGDRCTFRGMARWSGTSFAAPVVAGLIAARMSRSGENGQQAARALLKRSRRRALPGVGAIALPRRRRRRRTYN